uniref:Integrase, catalytic region, zinc finger, CCHC-type, peptidase aspartic, catalytic n=1 Tax=Tanacetum cinerariifolium TaxID=118510 RepID=A0A699GHC2_TANCI|nr:hypothetical protein [Tanacetum cinerariifolium]
MVAEDDETSKDKEIDKLMALISLSFKKIYKPTNNNLRTSSNTSRANHDNFLRINKSIGYENQRIGNVAGARETVDAADSRPIFDTELVQKVSNDDHYNVFAIESEHPEQSASIHDTYPIEQDEHNVIIDSFDMSYDREQIDQNDDDNDLTNERKLLASLIKKLKYEIDDSKNQNKFLETSNKVLIEKLKGEIKDFKNKNKSLESSNIRFKEANNKLSEINNLLYNDFKKSQAELTRRNNVEYAWKKEAQIKLYKTRKDKELDKVIALENKVKVLDNIVYKIGQSVQTMNMLNNKCRTSFAKPEFLKKVQRANPRLYDIGCYNNNLALMLAPESDEVIRLEKESRSKLRDLIKPFDYDKLNDLYDLFVPQREKSSKQRYFSERSRLSHTPANNGNSKESFNKQTTLLEKRMDESISLSQISTGNSKNTVLNEIDRLSREYYYADHINAILGEYTEIDEDKGIVISELKKLIEKLKGKYVNTKFEKSSVIRQPNAFRSQRPLILGKPNISQFLLKEMISQSQRMYKLHTEPTQTRTSQLPQESRKTNKRVSFSTGVIPTTSVSRPQLKSNPMGVRVMRNNSQGKKQEVEDQRRSVKFSKNKTSVTACNDSLKAKTLNVNFVCATCGKCVLNEKHDMCVLKSVNGVTSRTQMPIAMPVSTREPKCTVKQSVAKHLKKTVASESNHKSKNITRKLYDYVSKACSWWYPKFTPSGYKWKPNSEKENVNLNVSMPLGSVSGTSNILEPMTSKHSNVSNTPLVFNSFASRRDCLIHRRL